MAKAAFNKKKVPSTSKVHLIFKDETSTVLHLEHSCVWCWNLDTSELKLEIGGKVSKEVVEKDGEDQLDRLCEKLRSITKSEGGEEYTPNNETKEG